MYKNRTVEILFLLFSFVYIWLYFFFGFEGYYGWDDMEYAQLAYQWATGNIEISNNHFAYRLPVIVFTGLSYKIFGLNDFASALPAIVLSMLIILLVYFTLSKNDTRIIITAIITTLLMPYFIMYSNKLMSDMYVALGVFGSFVSFYLYRFRYKKYSILFSLLFSFLLFFAFLTKEVVVLIIPVLLFLFIVDVFKKQLLRFWLWAFIFGTIFFTIYHVIIWQITGSPLSRYSAILYNSYINPCSYELFPFVNTLKRIGYEFWIELILSGLFFLVAFVFFYFIKHYKSIFTYRAELYWVNVSILALLSANFMTKSYNSYSPMCLDVRHYLYLIPIISVAAAPNIVRFFYSATRNLNILIFISFVSIVYFFNINESKEKIFAFTVVAIFLLVFFRTIKSSYKIKISTYYWISFLLFWFYFSIYQMIYFYDNPFKEIKPFIEKHFKTDEKTIVITDPIMKRIANYYTAWDSSNVKFVSDRSSSIPYYDEAKHYFVYRNGITWWHLDKKKPEPMLLWYLIEPNIKLIDSLRGNELYIVDNYKKIIRPTNFLSFFCDMEKISTNFSYSKYFLDSLTSYSGYYSFKLVSQGFSPTLYLPFRYFVTDKTVKFEVEVAAKVLYKKLNNTNIVISVVDSLNETKFWLGKSLKKIIKPSLEWQDVLFKASYTPKVNEKHIFKAYLWNNDSSIVLIDNLLVNITVIEHL